MGYRTFRSPVSLVLMCLQVTVQECSLAKRKSLSLEVEKMSQGKQLSHFQAMAMLRKALVASFIATPGNSNKGVMEMKSTENRSELRRRSSKSALDCVLIFLCDLYLLCHAISTELHRSQGAALE